MNIIDPKSAFVSQNAKIDDDATICPFVSIEGECEIGSGAVIGPHSVVRDSVVGAGTQVISSVLVGAKIGERCTVGPFAYMRAGSAVGNGCRVGDFVEIKNATIGDGTKVAHLTYVGDCTIGRECNVGCGVVFVNYDGRQKHRSVVGDKCFIGSNCNIIAPVSIGSESYIAAGTTVTQSIEGGDLVVGRSHQVVKHGRGRGRYQ